MTKRRAPDGDPLMDDPGESEILALIRAVAAVGRERKAEHLTTVIVGVGITLLGAFVIGGFILSNQFYALQSQVAEWEKATDARITRLENQ